MSVGRMDMVPSVAMSVAVPVGSSEAEEKDSQAAAPPWRAWMISSASHSRWMQVAAPTRRRAWVDSRHWQAWSSRSQPASGMASRRHPCCEVC